MSTIKILCHNKQSIGCKVVVDALISNLKHLYDVSVVRDINDISCEDIVLPYGPKETFEALRAGLSVPISIMVDYHTLSLKNRTKYLISQGYLFNKNVIKSFVGFFYYYIVEKYIYSHCQNFMFVSQSDIDKIRKRFPQNSYYCVPNGVKLPTKVLRKEHSKKVSLGILSGWTPGTFIETRWFIEKCWAQISNDNVDAELVICGKFATNSMIEYFNSQPNVRFIGEVSDLSEFFNQIDIYVATKPIGCGILNKVLDAMAYKKLVIGIEQSFTGFTYMDESYIVCKQTEDYIDIIKKYRENPERFDKYIVNAYNNIVKFNNWEINYEKFIRELIADNVL